MRLIKNQDRDWFININIKIKADDIDDAFEKLEGLQKKINEEKDITFML